MSPDYLKLAARRVATTWEPYLHPEDFGYDFREWVSPYTKGAHAIGGIALVLQDWASASGISGAPDADIQLLGRTRLLKTNKRLEELLGRVFGLRLDQTYATNVFPFIKPGGMSSYLKLGDVIRAAKEFTAIELELARPTITVALGSLTHKALTRADIDAVHVPHPAARRLSIDGHEAAWRKALGKSAQISI